ncbi:MAG: hypothetical protein NTW67_01260 [Candidatus Woesearchaeota archaeon]|nr:hypothetical protein [Candidatus Woesearchaeota archaeon]
MGRYIIIQTSNRYVARFGSDGPDMLPAERLAKINGELILYKGSFQNNGEIPIIITFVVQANKEKVFDPKALEARLQQTLL